MVAQLTSSFIKYRYEVSWFASYGQVVMAAVVNSLLLRVVVLEEEDHVVFLVERWECAEAGVRG